MQRLERRRDGAANDAVTLCEVLARIYTDPKRAAGRLMDYQRQHGTERVSEALKAAPQEFGTLRREYPWWGIGVVYSTAAARQREW
ncbi:MAG TPA: hypothetical protein VFS20_06745 [Longimicrobium sp.]|nr:hypothetical protein [Longimicrobium sp.]